MVKTQKGITLIALIITIIVLIILAAVTIMTIVGDDGLMANTQKAKSNSAYAGAKECVSLAYSAVRTEIAIEAAGDSDYHAYEHAEDLLKTVKLDCVSDNFSFATTTTDSTATIWICYKDTAVQQYTFDDETPKYRGEVYFSITLEEQTASWDFDIDESTVDSEAHFSSTEG